MNAWRVRLQPSHPPVSKHSAAISKTAVVAHDILPKQLLAMGSGPSGVIVDYTYQEEPEEEDEKANEECVNQCVHGDLSNGGEGDRSSARGAAGGSPAGGCGVA